MAIEVVFEKRINNVNVCRDVDRGQRRQYFLLTFLSAVFVLGLLLYGWQQYRFLSLGYEIDKAKDKRDALLERQRELIVQEQTYSAPGRIEDNAKNVLGMVSAEPGQIVTLGPEEAATPLTASKQR